MCLQCTNAPRSCLNKPKLLITKINWYCHLYSIKSTFIDIRNNSRSSTAPCGTPNVIWLPHLLLGYMFSQIKSHNFCGLFLKKVFSILQHKHSGQLSSLEANLRLVISSRLLKRNRQMGWWSFLLLMVLVLFGPHMSCTSPFLSSQRECEMMGTDWGNTHASETHTYSVFSTQTVSGH